MSGKGRPGPRHMWESGRCKFCHVRFELEPGPRGGIWLRYWSPYIDGEIARHPRDRKGSPPCDAKLYGRKT